MLQVMLW